MPDGQVYHPAAACSGDMAETDKSGLLEILSAYAGLTIAVSGGIDSMVLAYVAHRSARLPVRMVHAVSPAVPSAATDRVRMYARREGWDLRVVEAGEFADPDYLKNPVNRCYFCKTNLYSRISGLAESTIASGANVDDLGDYRPGLLAASERDVVHPYIEAGIGKEGIRRLARYYGLTDIAELQAQPCLASRVETGITIDADDLAFVDRIETRLQDQFGNARTVRCRITAAGVVIEADASLSDAFDTIAALVMPDCRAEGRSLVGVRPYRRGSAFLHGGLEVPAGMGNSA